MKKTFLIILLSVIAIMAVSLGNSSEEKKIIKNIDEKLYGITIDDSWYDKYKIEDIVAAVDSMGVKPTVRIVMTNDKSADEYKDLFFKLSKVAYIMASPVDSYYMKEYEDSSGYLERFKNAYEVLGEYVDIWEIGNEINGTEWIKQEDRLIMDKVITANKYIKSQGGKTALTLYLYYPEKEMFLWIDKNVPRELARDVDYALISYYEDDNEGHKPKWQQVFDEFEKRFPYSMIGIGECGNTAKKATNHSKAKMAKAYYSMEIDNEKYVGGYFWWDFVKDCVPHEDNKIFETINNSMIKN